MKSVSDSLSNLGTKLIMYPISFAASIVISRYLGPEEKGIYTYIAILSSFFIPIFSFGIAGGIRYFISNKEYGVKEIGFSTLGLAILIGIINALLLFTFWSLGLLGVTGQAITKMQTGLVSLTMVFNSIFFFMSRVALGESRFKLLNSFTFMKGLLNPLLMMTLVFFLALRVDGVVYGLFGLNFIMALGITAYLMKSDMFEITINSAFLKKSLVYGVKGWLGDMAVKANVRLDQIILGGIVSSTSLGLYSVGVMLVELIWIIPDSVNPIIFNKIAAEHKDSKNKTTLIHRAHRILLFLATVIAVVWFLVCKHLVIPYGYGSEYLSSLLPMLLLLPGTLIYISAKVTTKLLSGTGHILETSKATAFGSLISIVLYLVLIPPYGIIGAAIATSIGYICVSVSCLMYTAKYFKLIFKDLFLIKSQDFYWVRNKIQSIKLKSKK